MKTIIYFLLIIALLPACKKQESQQPQTTDWISLFDGSSKAGWHVYNHTSDGSAWIIDDGAIHLDPSRSGRGDLVTDEEFENFELELEWKIDSCGNSGIMFNVVESPEYQYTFLTGPEMQVLDNACHPDSQYEKHRAGDLYDLIASSANVVKPAGEWNKVRIISNNGQVEFWLNDVNVVKFTMHTPEWDAMVAASKFKDMPAFGKARKGRIAIQDHDDKVWYRNIRIRKL
ncbi:MAG: DUF1080 domain-containing protein [Cyclobacteriaceae bacterium]|nr:DUF1080 domain-containing protein [Cyclobacteriaceae bacterium]MDW8332431.1 DUF1080 domain-containing protein [Cyclobacteriaceae bacterium]